MKTRVLPQDLVARRFGIDTLQEAVIYMRRDCHVCRSEGFEAQARVLVRSGGRSILATLNVVTNGLLEPGEAGLSDAAWRLLAAHDGDTITVSHAPPLDSLKFVRAKAYGQRLDDAAISGIIQDISAGRYSDMHLASFITACAGDHLDVNEVVSLAKAMVKVGKRLTWDHDPIVDKHSVGGLPGNRTTLIVVPMVTALGLTMPKTSSRAITSPAGTADTMETLAPVTLDIETMRRVVEREGGCIVWGGAAGLSPADDMLIRIEHALDFDAEGQLVASVVSKKAAAGSTHVVIDMPVGPTAKVRNTRTAHRLSWLLREVGATLGLEAHTIVTNGHQPVGRGIGPALEARDVLAVLRGEPGAPEDLRDRAVMLAGRLLEISGKFADEQGAAAARTVLNDGRAWKKFLAICEAQGGFREPPRAEYTHEVYSPREGRVSDVDNRRLARVAKLAGAPKAPSAGLEIHVRLGQAVSLGQPLYTIHAETAGELEYAMRYVRTNTDIIHVQEFPL